MISDASPSKEYIPKVSLWFQQPYGEKKNSYWDSFIFNLKHLLIQNWHPSKTWETLLLVEPRHFLLSLPVSYMHKILQLKMININLSQQSVDLNENSCFPEWYVDTPFVVACAKCSCGESLTKIIKFGWCCWLPNRFCPSSSFHLVCDVTTAFVMKGKFSKYFKMKHAISSLRSLTTEGLIAKLKDYYQTIW